VALVLGVAFLAYDIALDAGATLPGGDLRLAFLAVYVLTVVVVGSIATYLVVPLPSGAGGARSTRTPWSLALGLFAAVPIAYLVLVLLHEIVKPLVR
jgi:type VI protein secretion system component VasK